MTAPSVATGQPALTSAPRRYVLYRRRTVAQPDLPSALSETFKELYECISMAGVAPAGMPFTVYHNLPAPGMPWEVDICAPVAAPMTAPPCLDYTEMPSSLVVSLLHVGPYETLSDAYAAIEAYICEHALQPAGPPREFYFSEPSVPPSETRTLIERPVNQP
jgi:effector-binding domain-containing protein